MAVESYQKLMGDLKKLRLPAMTEMLDSYVKQAASNSMSYMDFLSGLVSEEVRYKEQRAVQSAIHRQQGEYSVPGTARDRENTSQHRTWGSGLRIRLQGVVYYMNDMVSVLMASMADNSFPSKLRQFVQSSLLIVDEVGYLPVSKAGANFLFQVVVKRYETGAIILTSNKSFADWGEVLGDSVIASGVLDRLLHHSTVFNIRGDSYRLREKKKELIGGEGKKPD